MGLCAFGAGPRHLPASTNAPQAAAARSIEETCGFRPNDPGVIGRRGPQRRLHSTQRNAQLGPGVTVAQEPRCSPSGLTRPEKQWFEQRLAGNRAAGVSIRGMDTPSISRRPASCWPARRPPPLRTTRYRVPPGQPLPRQRPGNRPVRRPQPGRQPRRESADRRAGLEAQDAHHALELHDPLGTRSANGSQARRLGTLRVRPRPKPAGAPSIHSIYTAKHSRSTPFQMTSTTSTLASRIFEGMYAGFAFCLQSRRRRRLLVAASAVGFILFSAGEYLGTSLGFRFSALAAGGGLGLVLHLFPICELRGVRYDEPQLSVQHRAQATAFRILAGVVTVAALLAHTECFPATSRAAVGSLATGTLRSLLYTVLLLPTFVMTWTEPDREAA